VKSNVIGLFLATIAIAIVVISIITSISVIERETGLYDKMFYSYVEPYNKQFIPMISNISNQVPPNEPIAISLPSSQFAYFVIHLE
jgi:ABC-type multidrug transport system permease subunit